MRINKTRFTFQRHTWIQILLLVSSFDTLPAATNK